GKVPVKTPALDLIHVEREYDAVCEIERPPSCYSAVLFRNGLRYFGPRKLLADRKQNLGSSLWCRGRFNANWVVCLGSLLILFLAKWFIHRGEALAEFEHPIQCCFVGLVPVS